MIDNIQDFAAYFGVTTPTELSRVLWKHDSYISSATLLTESDKTYCTEYSPEYNALTEFPSDVVSVSFNATKESCDYEPRMTPLVFPFPEEDIDEAIDYLNSELNMVDDWGEDFAQLYGSQSDSQFQHDKVIKAIADVQELVNSKYPQHSADTVFKPHESKLNAISCLDSDGVFTTTIQLPCTIESLELALQISWGE